MWPFRALPLVVLLLALSFSTASKPQPVKDVEMDCKGDLERNLEGGLEGSNFDYKKEKEEHVVKKDVTAHVRIISGQFIAQINSYGMIIGKNIKTTESNLLYEPDVATFMIDGVKAQRVLVDRVNARVTIFFIDYKRDKGYTFWLKCTVRKPQF